MLGLCWGYARRVMLRAVAFSRGHGVECAFRPFRLTVSVVVTLV